MFGRGQTKQYYTAVMFVIFPVLKMCDESEPVIGGRPISELKVVELKEELGKRGLSKIGNKNVLHERLKEVRIFSFFPHFY